MEKYDYERYLKEYHPNMSLLENNLIGDSLKDTLQFKAFVLKLRVKELFNLLTSKYESFIYKIYTKLIYHLK